MGCQVTKHRPPETMEMPAIGLIFTGYPEIVQHILAAAPYTLPQLSQVCRTTHNVCEAAIMAAETIYLGNISDPVLDKLCDIPLLSRVYNLRAKRYFIRVICYIGLHMGADEKISCRYPSTDIVAVERRCEFIHVYTHFSGTIRLSRGRMYFGCGRKRVLWRGGDVVVYLTKLDSSATGYGFIIRYEGIDTREYIAMFDTEETTAVAESMTRDLYRDQTGVTPPVINKYMPWEARAHLEKHVKVYQRYC